MRQIAIVPLGICATACVDGRNAYDRVEFRFPGGLTRSRELVPNTCE
jgi:hypothetical protein